MDPDELSDTDRRFLKLSVPIAAFIGGLCCFAPVVVAGFVVEDVRCNRRDLLEMRDTIQERVDYRPFLGLLGERGTRLLDAIDEVQDAVEDGRISSISLVAGIDD